jgi:ribulose-phosphate 3-epimerase
MLFELHLMVNEPIEYLERWSKAGFRRFLGHVEQMSDQTAFVSKAQELGEVGLVIDGKTPLSAVNVSWEDLDTFLVMTIDAGASGQVFQPQQLKKIESLATQTLLPLEVDGGIDDKTMVQAAKKGATRFVTTSYLFHQGAAPQDRYDHLLDLLNAEVSPRE